MSIGTRKGQNPNAENQISEMDNILEKLSKNAEEHRFLKKTLRKMRIGIKRSEQTLCQCKSSRGKNQNGARTLRRCIEEISVS